jgi:hypothetical protein
MDQNKNIPLVHFNALTTGIIVSSERLKTTRFVAFDTPGQCRSCKSDHLQIDHCITKDGIFLYSNRFKAQKYIEFDLIENFPADCFFSVKCRGRLYKIPHVNKEVESDKGASVQYEQPEEKKRKKEDILDENPKADATPAIVESMLTVIDLIPKLFEEVKELEERSNAPEQKADPYEKEEIHKSD